MPTSLHDPDEAGFTLAEMLLVVAITAMAAGLVVGRGLPGQKRIDHAALQSFVRTVRAEAMRSDRILALQAGPDGHSFVAGARVLALAPDHQTSVRSGDGDAITFGPDGSTSGGLLRVLVPGGEDRLALAPLTGTLLP